MEDQAILEAKDVEKRPNNLTSSEEDNGSIDDLIEELFQARTWKYTFLLVSLNFLWIAAPSQVYITAFAGTVPTPGDSWTCVSQKCKDLVGETPSLSKTFPCSLTEIKHGVQVPLLKNEDIQWDLYHSSFAVEFDLYCDSHTKKTLISSIFFGGALTGMIGGGYLTDHIGRKKTSILGFTFLVFSLLCGTFCHNYIFLTIIRFFQGIGSYLLSTGMTILCLELTPKEFRKYVIGVLALFWGLGYFLATGLHYFIPDWNLMFLGSAIAVAITSFPVFICIESPRYFMINNDFDSTRESLKALASLTTSDLDPDKLDLNNYLTSSAKTRTQSLTQQFKDLLNNPTLLGETLIQIFIWLCVGMFFYGKNFAWEAIIPNIYVGFLIAGIAELLTALVTVPLIGKFGRRRAHIIGYFGTMLLYLLAIPDVQIVGQWTLMSISCLLSTLFVYGCFAGVYLWTGELAPTSHRGMVFCVCSSASTIGSFVGPYIFNSLTPISLGGLAFLAALCTVGCFLLVETGDKTICLTGQDVVVRRKNYFKYRV